MKKISIALVALAAAVAISPVAKADTIDFGYTGYNNGIHVGNNASGTLTGTLSGTQLDITGGSMTVALGLDAGTYDLYTAGSPSPDGISYDNIVYTASPYLDGEGLLFYKVGDPSFEVNIYYVGGAPTSPVWEFLDSTGSDNQGSFVTFPPSGGSTVTPEPSSLFLLGTGLIGLAFVAFRKAKSAARPSFSLSAL